MNITNNFKLVPFQLPIQQNLDDLYLNARIALDSIWNKIFPASKVIVNQEDISLDNLINFIDLDEDQEVVIKQGYSSSIDSNDENTGAYSEETEKDYSAPEGYSAYLLYAKDYSPEDSCEETSDVAISSEEESSSEEENEIDSEGSVIVHTRTLNIKEIIDDTSDEESNDLTTGKDLSSQHAVYIMENALNHFHNIRSKEKHSKI